VNKLKAFFGMWVKGALARGAEKRSMAGLITKGANWKKTAPLLNLPGEPQQNDTGKRKRFLAGVNARDRLVTSRNAKAEGNLRFSNVSPSLVYVISKEA